MLWRLFISVESHWDLSCFQSFSSLWFEGNPKSTEGRGAYEIFYDSSAAFERERRLFKIQYISCKQQHGKSIERVLEHTHLEVKMLSIKANL